MGLDAEREGDVVILASSSDSGEAQVGGPLTFTSSNWDSPQAFTITGIDDSIADGEQQAVFTVRVDDDESHDAYDDVADQSVTAAVADDETAGIDRKSTRLNQSQAYLACRLLLEKKKKISAQDSMWYSWSCST